MQFYNSLIQVGLLFFLLGVSACSNNTEQKRNINDYDWVKKTSFKHDFNDKGAYIEVLKGNNLSLVTTILDEVEAGRLAAFHFYDKKQMSKAEIDYLFHPKDTVSVYDMELGKEVMKPTVGELNRASVTKVRVEQEWFFNVEQMRMDVEVKAIAPMQTIFNSDGSERGDAPLFWVILN